MPPMAFGPTISADERPQTYALDCAATGTGFPLHSLQQNICVKVTSKSSPKPFYVIHVSCIRSCSLFDSKLHLQCSVDLSITSVVKSSLPETVQFKIFCSYVPTSKWTWRQCFVVMILGPKSLEYISIIVIDPKKFLRQFSVFAIAEILKRWNLGWLVTNECLMVLLQTGLS